MRVKNMRVKHMRVKDNAGIGHAGQGHAGLGHVGLGHAGQGHAGQGHAGLVNGVKPTAPQTVTLPGEVGVVAAANCVSSTPLPSVQLSPSGIS